MFPQTILSLKYTPKVPHNPKKKINQILDLDRFMHVLLFYNFYSLLTDSSNTYYIFV